MSLGEKIRYARRCCGLSQEQLAERMCVSRSAIAKWETDKGLPDIENLKAVSRHLGISVDSLLDDTAAESAVVRKPYNLSNFGQGCKKVKKDRMMRREFPDDKICALLGRPILAAGEKATPSGLSPASCSTPEFLKTKEKEFYLVEQEDLQLFVTVTDSALEIRPLTPKQTAKTFQLGNWAFIRGNDLTEEFEK